MIGNLPLPQSFRRNPPLISSLALMFLSSTILSYIELTCSSTFLIVDYAFPLSVLVMMLETTTWHKLDINSFYELFKWKYPITFLIVHSACFSSDMELVESGVFRKAVLLQTLLQCCFCALLFFHLFLKASTLLLQVLVFGQFF